MLNHTTYLISKLQHNITVSPQKYRDAMSHFIEYVHIVATMSLREGVG